MTISPYAEFEVVNAIKGGVLRWLQRPGNQHHIEMLTQNNWIMCLQQALPDMLYEDMEAEDWILGNVVTHQGIIPELHFELAVHAAWLELNEVEE